jgi:hypothetical protein
MKMGSEEEWGRRRREDGMEWNGIMGWDDGINQSSKREVGGVRIFLFDMLVGDKII